MDTRENETVIRRVREALDRHVALVEPRQDSLARLRARVARERARRRNGVRWMITSGAVAAGVVVLLVLTVMLPPGGHRDPAAGERGAAPVAGAPRPQGPDRPAAADPHRPPAAFVAYSRDRLSIVDVQSGRVLRDLPDTKGMSVPMLTSDGSTVYGMVARQRLVRVDVSSGNVHIEADPARGLVSAYAATPDGSRLGYAIEQDGDARMTVIDKETGGEQRLVSRTLRRVQASALSPDGGRLAFIGDSEADLTLQVLDLAGSDSLDDARTVPNPEGCVHQTPVWTSSGLFAVQVCGQSGLDITNSLVRVNPDGGGTSVLADLPNQVSTLSAWSGRAGTLFLISTSTEVYVADLATPDTLRKVPADRPLDQAGF